MSKHTNYGMYAVAAAILVVGLAAFDVPIGSFAAFGLLLACPLMMILMMRGMGGHGGGHGMHGHDVDDGRDSRVDQPDERPTGRGNRR
jgi:hypothetical protein